jgi:hypothetical protein
MFGIYEGKHFSVLFGERKLYYNKNIILCIIFYKYISYSLFVKEMKYISCIKLAFRPSFLFLSVIFGY